MCVCVCVTFLQGKELFLFSWCYAIEHEWQLIFGHAEEAKIHPSTGAECKQTVFRERAKKKLRNVENAEQGLAAMKECESEPGVQRLGKREMDEGTGCCQGPFGS